MNKNLEVACPHCKKKFNYFESTFRPFCCERCKMVDLGHWLNETYRVPLKNQVQETPTEEIDENERPPQEDEDENENY